MGKAKTRNAKSGGTAAGNDRLAAALKSAERTAKRAKKRGDIKTRLTSARASRLRKAYLAEQNFLPTSPMRIHKDVLVLAKTAWPNCYERVRECSAAIRGAAMTKLGLTASSPRPSADATIPSFPRPSYNAPSASSRGVECS